MSAHSDCSGGSPPQCAGASTNGTAARGFAAIRGDWLAAARGIGEEIAVRNGGGEMRGRFAGLDQSGRLILELRGGGIEKISAGDVFPLDLRGGRAVPGRPG